MTVLIIDSSKIINLIYISAEHCRRRRRVWYLYVYPTRIFIYFFFSLSTLYNNVSRWWSVENIFQKIKITSRVKNSKMNGVTLLLIFKKNEEKLSTCTLIFICFLKYFSWYTGIDDDDDGVRTWHTHTHHTLLVVLQLICTLKMYRTKRFSL